MKTTMRFHPIDDEGMIEHHNGDYIKTSDFESLQKELQNTRALLLAAIQLIPEDTTMGELANLAMEAREVFMGVDKARIAKLQDEVRNLQENIQHMRRPPRPGVNVVYGVKLTEKSRYVLALTSVCYGPNGGLEIEVQLP